MGVLGRDVTMHDGWGGGSWVKGGNFSVAQLLNRPKSSISAFQEIFTSAEKVFISEGVLSAR